MGYTSTGSYFEEFAAGDTFEHARGRTVTQADNLAATHGTLNTAQAHFDLRYSTSMMDGAFAERLVMGGLTLAIVVGLTSADLSENALGDLGLTGVRFPNPVYPGDTLCARSEVLAVADVPERSDAGSVQYRFTGSKDDGSTVVEGVRTILVKRRMVYGERDGNAAVREV
ncbi:MaoC family dehydratase [Actinophytocola sp.]|uniref:MaoC family dehydratase n=1 Tax=Actinophytocola sp. TaxID=1872138 RepID=UPI003D6BC50C